MNNCNIAIIGAGPYGLSIAAHLRGQGVDFRIFGHPMSTWETQMPKGMRLKSEGFASCLYDGDHALTLRKYSEERNLPYADIGLPVPLGTFIAYGKEFQKRCVPELEHRLLVSLDQGPDGFSLSFDDGERLTAKRLVVAVGICHFGYVPPELRELPSELMTHSSAHSDLGCFRDREVAVVGAGASAVDLAALLHEAGAHVQLIARKPAIRFHDPPRKKPRSLFERVQNPVTGIGSGWKLFFCANMPWAFRHLPEGLRLRAVKRILGPAPGWFVKDNVVGKVPMHLGVDIESGKEQDGRVALTLKRPDGSRDNMVFDHVIAATGYRVDLQRLRFVSADLQERIRKVEQSPVLSAHFESSVPGLYFVGTAAANTFGPLMRFACGAEFAARTLSNHLAATVPHRAAWKSVSMAKAQEDGVQ
jgi:thioredoxin reductase